MMYRELCALLNQAGWESHAIAACNTNYTRGLGNKHFTVGLLRSLRTCQDYENDVEPPEFDVANAVPAAFWYVDEHGRRDKEVLIDNKAGLFAAANPGRGNRRLVGYVSDIPADHWLRGKSTPRPDIASAPLAVAPAMPAASDTSLPPPRVEYTELRIVRDTKASRQVKSLYAYKCQLCGPLEKPLRLANGTHYAEAHHIRPLGGKHLGPDDPGNLLCVCPNHHALLDYRAIRLERSTLRIAQNHGLSDEHIGYHNRLFEEGKNPR